MPRISSGAKLKYRKEIVLNFVKLTTLKTFFKLVIKTYFKNYSRNSKNKLSLAP